MRHSIKTLALIFAIATMQGCATKFPTNFRDTERSAIATDLGVDASKLTFISRCDYGVVKQGATLTTDSKKGICATSQETLTIRPVDMTTGLSRPGIKLAFKQMESVSRYALSSTEQVQIRIGEDLYAIFARPDDGYGGNIEGDKRLFTVLQSSGVNVVESKARVLLIVPGSGGGSTYVPIIIPARGK